VNSTKHDVIADNTRERTIRKMLMKKCSHYYQFEELMRNSLTINSSFIMKSTRLDIESFIQSERMKNTEN
jgi:hypothetical protein